MENPKQAIYAPDELFALKPEAIKIAEVKTAAPSLIVSNEIPAVVVQPNTDKPNVWAKHKSDCHRRYYPSRMYRVIYL